MVTYSGLLLSSSTSQKVFDLGTENEILLIYATTFEEIYQTLIRKKFDKYLSMKKRFIPYKQHESALKPASSRNTRLSFPNS